MNAINMTAGEVELWNKYVTYAMRLTDKYGNCGGSNGERGHMTRLFNAWVRTVGSERADAMLAAGLSDKQLYTVSDEVIYTECTAKYQAVANGQYVSLATTEANASRIAAKYQGGYVYKIKCNCIECCPPATECTAITIADTATCSCATCDFYRGCPGCGDVNNPRCVCNNPELYCGNCGNLLSVCGGVHCLPDAPTAVYDTDASTVTLSTGKVYRDIVSHTDLEQIVKLAGLSWPNVSICGKYVSYHAKFRKLAVICAVCNCGCTGYLGCETHYNVSHTCSGCAVTALYDTDVSTVTLSTGKVYTYVVTYGDLSEVVRHAGLSWENVSICGKYAFYHNRFRKIAVVCSYCHAPVDNDCTTICDNCHYRNNV